MMGALGTVLHFAGCLSRSTLEQAYRGYRLLRSLVCGQECPAISWGYSTEVIPLQSHATIQPLLQPSIPQESFMNSIMRAPLRCATGLRHKEASFESTLRHDFAAFDSLRSSRAKR